MNYIGYCYFFSKCQILHFGDQINKGCIIHFLLGGQINSEWQKKLRRHILLITKL